MSVYKNSENYSAIIKPYLSFILLLPIVIYLIVNKGEFILFVDHLNLLFHEGGHGIFSIFGQFIYTLGGSLMQVIIPSLFILYFAVNRQRLGVQISLIFLAQNFMNIGVYVSDARDQNLPLIGGNNTYHDWTFILSRINMLEYDKTIGDIFYFSAIVVLIFSLSIPLFWKEYPKAKIDLNI